ncbi:NADH:flavin oxidoreductase/NADH oxidase family protein [Psychrosphaera sp. B3R10]|uniref:NADH:flavin oxidoreductase/NADH oxidase family protein n=1 Tax=unclassified Psychrosphaera TaxID=2641570 RepID=UPI001C085846|nr:MULTISPECIES: NADH:flavin oxidoreductase/NADH oxidase family protein [unclassified Psychrosphaera]MBU2881704.1 NADH:flavin oxidoreductase/NADH oxidase family protein [Psychrosphaera sp. I2R16]MBU2991041.1 NADH:flavin oxidoreductase/NADH oxidase family protein [Psychrosphaera sp. B3R10]
MPNRVDLFSSFTLPSGLTLKNRVVKASMEEGLGNGQQLPDSEIFKLYQTWSEGGVGTILTGNVMVDRLAMTGPGGIALEHNTDLRPFVEWAHKGKLNGARLIMQINHPGRQVFANMEGNVLSPSDVALDLGKHSKLFGQPKAMTEEDITDVINRFVTTSKRAYDAGFDGVEIHAAHGYLIAQFLSPLTNKRHDKWGGEIENRARLLFVIIEQVKEAVSSHFSVSVKLNSADFQRGGFDVDDAEWVVKKLSMLGLDFVELSGGSYESPAMQGKTADGRTLQREAYFLEFAAKIAKVTDLPIMTTGGIKRLPVARHVVNSGPQLVGIASAFAFVPNLVDRWQLDSQFIAQTKVVRWHDKTLSGLANMALVTSQLRRIGNGKKPKTNASGIWTLLIDQIRKRALTKRYIANKSE